MGISSCVHRSLVSGKVNREAHLAYAAADAVRRTEEPSRLTLIAGVTGQAREDFEEVRHAQKRSDARATRKGVMGVLLSSFRVALSDRNASTCGQRHRQVPT